MKLNKIFTLATLATTMLFATSCDEDFDYTAAEAPSGAQVYFSSELSSEYEISPDASSFNVPLSRVDVSGAQTVNLTATLEAGSLYSVPASVTFNAGESTANIPVSYDPAKIEYGKYETITIKIADETITTPYGVSEFSFTAGVTDWGPWEKWNDAGTAVYYYNGYWTGVDDSQPFVYRHNLITTNLYQFKISNWGMGEDLVWDYDSNTGIVSCGPQWAADNANYGAVTVADFQYYATVVRGAADPGVYGYFDEANGIIACPLYYYVDAGYFGADYEYIYIDGYNRADYTIGLSYIGTLTDTKNNVFAVGNLTLGRDATDVKAIVMSASDDASAVADAIAAGDLDATDVAGGRIEVPIAENQTGNLQLIAVVLNEGEVKGVASAKFEYFGGGVSPWKSLGTGMFVDDFIIPLFGYAPEAYPVEIEEHTETPGLYRLVNAYAPIVADFGEVGGYENIEVHAENPNGVYILEQLIGWDFGYGDAAIVTEGGDYVGYYGDFDYVYQNAPQLFGTLEDGVMTFPVFHNESNDKDYQGYVTTPEGTFLGCMNGSFEIYLPSALQSRSNLKAKMDTMKKAAQFERNLKAGSKVSAKQRRALSKKIVKASAELRVLK